MPQFNLDDYEPVDARIKKFYADHEDGRILTELVEGYDATQVAVFKAYIYLGEINVSTGYAMEKMGEGFVNKTSHLENSETSAIGRALANFNYSGDKRPSREEMEKVQRQEKPKNEEEAKTIHDDCMKLLQDKLMDGALNQDEYDKAVQWLDGHAMTMNGMGVAKKKLEERFAAKEEEVVF